MISNNYLDNKRSMESFNLEKHGGHSVCVEDVHKVAPMKVWNTVDR